MSPPQKMRQSHPDVLRFARQIEVLESLTKRLRQDILDPCTNETTAESSPLPDVEWMRSILDEIETMLPHPRV